MQSEAEAEEIGNSNPRLELSDYTRNSFCTLLVSSFSFCPFCFAHRFLIRLCPLLQRFYHLPVLRPRFCCETKCPDRNHRKLIIRSGVVRRHKASRTSESLPKNGEAGRGDKAIRANGGTLDETTMKAINKKRSWKRRRTEETITSDRRCDQFLTSFERSHQRFSASFDVNAER